MSLSESLVQESLRHAQLADSDAVEDFWSTPLKDAEETRQAYVRFSAEVPLDKGIVFYETMSGDRMNDNPYAIFKYLRSHPEYGSFLHVWSLGEHGTIPDEFAGLEDVVFAPRGTLSYVYYLAAAGHIICNAILPEYLTRREGQRYLNTWHGIPYKTLGRNAARARFGSATGLGTFLKATHVVTPCEFMTNALLSSYSMSGASTALIAETGYPRIDLTVNADSDSVAGLREQLGVVVDGDGAPVRPVVMYAPTWRSEDGSDTVDTEQLLHDLETLAHLDIQLIYRGHHRIGRLIKDSAIGDRVGHVIVPPQEISSNELLAAVDILITDYSSIFFDFLPTGRPIIHYLYDLDDYASARGLNLGVEDLPGVVARDAAELVYAVEGAASQLSAVPQGTDVATSPPQGGKYRAAQERFAPHEDGGASARAVEFFFGDSADGVPVRAARDGRPTIVFWAGCVADDKRSAEFLQEVIRFAKAPKFQVTMVVDRAATFDRELLKTIKSLKSRLSVIAYDAHAPILREPERAVYEGFVAESGTDFDTTAAQLRHSEILSGLFSREYRRRLDDAHFDALFLAPQLTRHELALAALACKDPLTRGRHRAFRLSLMSPMQRTAEVLLPKGTARRRQAERAYRALRRRLKKSPSA